MDYHLSVQRLKLLNKQLNKQPAIYNFNLFTFHAHAILFYKHNFITITTFNILSKTCSVWRWAIFKQNQKIESFFNHTRDNVTWTWRLLAVDLHQFCYFFCKTIMLALRGYLLSKFSYVKSNSYYRLFCEL